MSCAFAALLCATVLVAQRPADQGDRPDPAKAFFASGDVVHIAISLAAVDRQRLRESPREYVPASLSCDGRGAWTPIGIKLKGAAGSFRNIDESPGFTVHLGKFGATHRLHGLQRFHLNNCAQDDTRLCEWLGHEVFAAAGRPAPRVTHAIVSLDGARLGLYVLREAFDEQFLRRAFGTTQGNLYDGGFCQDVDGDLEKDAGSGPDDRSDLRELCEICRGAPTERVAKLAARIDIDAFLDFVAIEAMLGHWDGYSQNRNNFRLWSAVPPGLGQFLPHGMDQLFGDAEASVLAHPSALVASAVMQHAPWRQRYRERLRALLPLLAPQRLRKPLEAAAARLQRELRRIDDGAARAHAEAVRNLVERITARHASLRDQVRAPEPKPLQFEGNKPVAVRGWQPAAETEAITLRPSRPAPGALLEIAIDARGLEPQAASWRTSVLLGQGRYRLLATVRCRAIEAPPKGDGDQPTGGVRLAVDDARSDRLFGDQGWRELVCEFEVHEYQRDVELQLGLRAMAGAATFRGDSLRLERAPQ